MSFYVNDVALNSITFNNQDVNAVYYNGVHIWGQMIWDGLDNASWGDLQALCKAKQSGAITTWPSDIVLGATKTVNLSTPVLGTSSFDVRIIGIDNDGDGVLTFMAVHPLIESYNEATTSWNSSNAKKNCQLIYQYGDINGYTKLMSKPVYSISGNLNSYSENVWLLSSREIGLTNSYYDKETDTSIKGESTSGLPYSYFTSDTKRKLTQVDGSICRYSLRSISTYNANTEITQLAVVNTDGTGFRISVPASGCMLVPAFNIG